MLTSTCRNCGTPKTDYQAPECEACTTTRREAEQHFAAEHPRAAESDILYAGRQAVLARSHHAHRNFVDPRDFSAGRGMIPVPPQTPQSQGPPAEGAQ